MGFKLRTITNYLAYTLTYEAPVLRAQGSAHLIRQAGWVLRTENLSSQTLPDQERDDDLPPVEEIAVTTTVELLYDHHREACEPVTTIAAGLRSTIEDDERIIPDEPTADGVLITAGELRYLAEFLETRVISLVSE